MDKQNKGEMSLCLDIFALMLEDSLSEYLTS